MTLTKRGIIRTFCLSLALVAVLAFRNVRLMSEQKNYNQTLNYNYSRAVEDLADACENLSNTLEKQLYAGSGKMQQNLAVKLYQEAASAKAALAQLPMEQLNLENTYKFLSQVGNYSLSISEKMMAGNEISTEEYENISSLYEFSRQLSQDMWSLENSLSSGEITLLQTEDENSPKITDGFSNLEQSLESCPTLIYDGPFSDNILEKQPKMTSSAKEVSSETALIRASAAINVNPSDLSKHEDVAGNMPAWRFMDENSSVACEVTKQGGYISYFLKSRNVEKSSIDDSQAVKLAQDFLDELGILSMETTYYEIISNVMTINFAYNDLGKTVYTDLVKVSVAMDDGEILGYDARGFLVNHYKRSYPENLISLNRAKEEVSPKLKINSSKTAVIPTDNLDEKLTYEFYCTAENGRKVLVYINAVTGEEEQILMLEENSSGILTI